MYNDTQRQQALSMIDRGLTISEASRQTGISRWAIRDWRLKAVQGQALHAGPYQDCPRCSGVPKPPAPPDAYTYLLGLYLGDGCISPVGEPRKEIWALRISCANAWPGLIEQCVAAVSAIRPQNKVRRVPCPGCTEVNSHSKHWPCLFPQHRPGRKHERKIELARWQQEIVNECTQDFVRGLIHSDGCRTTNRIRRPLKDGDRWYEYPRYNFTNVSIDIQQLFTNALDRLGVPWTQMNQKNISVATREGVARLDEFVGPKH
ncbi:helix-turn-helix domain-containing protein [Actinomadura fibrosa]|uniref:Transcriptional regulator n=1 Tax=Actinomadura fibrosa TaxID=111802 RepID=A0ABW2XMW4_9ACTN|nr:helix-turn-helix domain containing protein [Actinomadura fibrosa]